MFRNKILLLIFLLFGLLYCSISLVNNYTFRTYALDLGLETNSIYDYAHFRFNNCMLMQPQYDNVLSVHFSLLTMLISPLGYLLKSYTLLIVQIVCILLGGYGSYLLIKLKTSNTTLANFSLVHFFVIWGIYSALAYDFHHNVLGAMIVPWFFCFLEKRNWNKIILCFLLILISKENMALWMGFICIGLLVNEKPIAAERKKIGFLAIIAFLYFILIFKIVMPALANSGREYLYFNFESLGATPIEAILKIIQHPISAFSLLLENQTGNADWNGFKPEFYYMLFISGGFAIFFRPGYLIMILPLLAQKMYNSGVGKWGLESHYSIEFVPVIIIAFYDWVNHFESKKLKIYLSLLFIFLSAIGTFNSFQNSYSIRYNKENYRFDVSDHYKRNFNVSEVYKAFNSIPDNAKISASTEVVPHFSWRESIYLFPVVNDADYIVLLNDRGTYPLSPEEFKIEVDQLKNNNQWTLLYDQNSALIFKRKQS